MQSSGALAATEITVRRGAETVLERLSLVVAR